MVNDRLYRIWDNDKSAYISNGKKSAWFTIGSAKKALLNIQKWGDSVKLNTWQRGGADPIVITDLIKARYAIHEMFMVKIKEIK